MSYETIAYAIKMGGTISFFSIFLIALLYAYWPSNKSKFKQAAAMPLSHDDKPIE
jgi:cytochrome c oxidase cbb3-type subunit 4